MSEDGIIDVAETSASMWGNVAFILDDGAVSDPSPIVVEYGGSIWDFAGPIEIKENPE